MALAWARKSEQTSSRSFPGATFFNAYKENALWYAAIFVVYLAASLFSSYMYRVVGTEPAVVLAPQGIALAAALIFGYRAISITALATFIVSLYAGNPLILAFLAVVANIVQPAFTLFALDLLRVDRLLKNAWDFYIYIAIAAFTSSIAPTVNVLGRILYNSSTSAPVNTLIWSNLWIAGLVSALILTPFLVRIM